MKIERKNLRLAEWFDADDHSIAYVVETLSAGKWTGVMLGGEPQAFDNRAAAEKALDDMTGLEATTTDRCACVSKTEGKKGIVPPDSKHIVLN